MHIIKIFCVCIDKAANWMWLGVQLPCRLCKVVVQKCGVLARAVVLGCEVGSQVRHAVTDNANVLSQPFQNGHSRDQGSTLSPLMVFASLSSSLSQLTYD